MTDVFQYTMPEKRKFETAIPRFEKRLCTTIDSLIRDKLHLSYERGEPYPVPVNIAIKHLEAVARETWAEGAVLDCLSDSVQWRGPHNPRHL